MLLKRWRFQSKYWEIKYPPLGRSENSNPNIITRGRLKIHFGILNTTNQNDILLSTLTKTHCHCNISKTVTQASAKCEKYSRKTSCIKLPLNVSSFRRLAWWSSSRLIRSLYISVIFVITICLFVLITFFKISRSKRKSEINLASTMKSAKNKTYEYSYAVWLLRNVMRDTQIRKCMMPISP